MKHAAAGLDIEVDLKDQVIRRIGADGSVSGEAVSFEVYFRYITIIDYRIKKINLFCLYI